MSGSNRAHNFKSTSASRLSNFEITRANSLNCTPFGLITMLLIFSQMPSFLSDIGGLMGMWIGVSVLTVVELLELIATLLMTMFKTFTKKKEGVVDVKPSENCAQRL